MSSRLHPVLVLLGTLVPVLSGAGQQTAELVLALLAGFAASFAEFGLLLEDFGAPCA